MQTGIQIGCFLYQISISYLSVNLEYDLKIARVCKTEREKTFHGNHDPASTYWFLRILHSQTVSGCLQ